MCTAYPLSGAVTEQKPVARYDSQRASVGRFEERIVPDHGPVNFASRGVNLLLTRHSYLLPLPKTN